MEQRRWRQALTISLILNVVLVIVLGNFIGPSRIAFEELIEIELVAASTPQATAISAASTAAPAPLAVPVPQQAVSATTSSAFDGQLQTEQLFLPGTESTESNQIPANGGSATPEASSGPGIASATHGSAKPRVILPPRILQRVEPSYPQAARQQGLEGIVRVRVEVSVEGSATSASIAASSGHGLLDEAALQAVRQWRFVPAKEEGTGIAVSCITSFPVSFQLN